MSSSPEQSSSARADSAEQSKVERGIPDRRKSLTFLVLLRPVSDVELLADELDERAWEVLGVGPDVCRDEVVAVRHAAYASAPSPEC